MARQITIEAQEAIELLERIKPFMARRLERQLEKMTVKPSGAFIDDLLNASVAVRAYAGRLPIAYKKRRQEMVELADRLNEYAARLMG